MLLECVLLVKPFQTFVFSFKNIYLGACLCQHKYLHCWINWVFFFSWRYLSQIREKFKNLTIEFFFFFNVYVSCFIGSFLKRLVTNGIDAMEIGIYLLSLVVALGTQCELSTILVT